MWALILLFGILLPLVILGLIAAAAGTAIILVRRREGAERERPVRVPFSGILFGYTGLMTLIGVFVVVTGLGLGGKAALAIIDKDFSYERDQKRFDTSTFREVEDAPKSDDEIEDEMRTDTIVSVVMLFIGMTMVAPHAFGAALLRRRRAAGERPVARGITLIGLATATIGFLAAGGTALTSVLQRLAEENARGWRDHHPGEPLALALLLMPVAAWFAYRLWTEFTLDVPELAAPERAGHAA